jgi:hypothetical protein
MAEARVRVMNCATYAVSESELGMMPESRLKKKVRYYHIRVRAAMISV